MNNAQPIPSSAAASTHGAASPSLELLEARQVRDALKQLLRKEQAAMAEFLVALSDFDRRRGWEPLGHAQLFAFLVADLHLSKSAAYYRRSAAELIQRFPEVIEPLREGKLCLSTVGELAKVLTAENEATVLPRFFGLSSREAQELVAELLPRPVPSTRMVVTRVPDRTSAGAPPLSFTLALTSHFDSSAYVAPVPAPSASTTGEDPNMAPLWRFPTSGIAFGGGTQDVSVQLLPKRDEIVPLTASVRRIHFNVDKQVVRKLKVAREGLSHSIRGATMEQVLEAALDLLLEKQARARGLVKRPRATIAEAPPPLALIPTEPTPTTPTAPTEIPPATPTTTEPRPRRREGPREPIPAAVRRAVWARDGDHCTWPLDGGGCCGSTHQLELDHIIPWAEWGPDTVENLRVVCGRHNALSARQAFGGRVVGRYRHGSAARRPAGQRPSNR
jgi:hypothetical protein